MATLHCCANGTFTAAATWALCNATGTTLLDSQAGNQALTTAFVSSQAFTPGAITIDGIAVKIASRALTPTGTMTVRLAQAGVAVAGTTVTINVSDIPDDIGPANNAYSGCTLGWYFFRFGAPVTLAAATAYTLQASTSSASQVNLFRDGTAGNWSRLLRTTTTQAPAAGDSMFVGGEWTAAGTYTSRTVTYNETASTDYGSASTILASFGVSKGGTLTLQTSAATAYRLRLSGHLQFWQESVVTFGTTGTPLPSGSTFRCEFDCAADGDFGLQCYTAFDAHASDPWGTGVTRTRLAADAAAAATSLTVDDSTGWKSGEKIAIAGTTRNAAESETRDLNADAVGTGLAFAAGLTYAHQGNAAWKAQADVINVTRPIHFTNVTAAAATFAYFRGGFAMTCSWVEWSRFGYSGRSGFDLPATAATYTFDACAFHDCELDVLVPASSGSASFVMTDCVSWGTGTLVLASGTQSNSFTATDCTFIGTNVSSAGAAYLGAGGTLTWNGVRVSSWNFGARLDGPVATDITDCEFYNQGTGISGNLLINASNVNVRVTRTRFWRAGQEGCQVVNSFDVVFEECEFYGNSGIGLDLDDSKVECWGCIFASETGYVQITNVQFSGAESGAGIYRFYGCDFSTVTGNRIAATTDLNPTGGSVRYHILVSGGSFNGSTDIAATVLEAGSTLAIQRRDGTPGANSYRMFGYGQIDYETTTTGDASPAMKMTPEHARRRFQSQRMAYPVASGKQITFSVKVRKDGSYNGDAPRLVLKANGALGVDKDVVLDTHSAAVDTWETLTGQSAAAEEDGVLEVVVDCNGTAGSIYVDDFSASST